MMKYLRLAALLVLLCPLFAHAQSPTALSSPVTLYPPSTGQWSTAVLVPNAQAAPVSAGSAKKYDPNAGPTTVLDPDDLRVLIQHGWTTTSVGLATGSVPGIIKPDGSSCTVTVGVLTCGGAPISAGNVLCNATGSTAVAAGCTGAQVLANLPGVYAGAQILPASVMGIKPSNSATTNDMWFAALKVVMQANRNITWDLQYDQCPGTVQFTNNRIFWSVNNIIWDGNGCSFQNVTSNTSYANAIPLETGDIFSTIGDVVWPGAVTFTNGYLINTALAGATSVITTTAADAGNFNVGDRVLISGYDQQQSGLPPNLRYFDYKTVTAANASTGRVSFGTDALSTLYDSRWWDTANYSGTGLAFGAPRILDLTRSDMKFPHFCWIRNSIFLANPTTPSEDELQLSCDIVIYDNVTAGEFNAVESGQTYVINHSSFTNSANSSGGSGGDKLVDRLVIEDSTVGAPIGATSAIVDNVGVNDLSILRSKIIGSIYQSSPRNEVVNDVDIVPAASAFQAIASSSLNPIRTVSIANTHIFNTGGISFGFTNVASPGLSFTVGAVSGTTLQMTWNSAAMTVADELDYGMSFTDTTKGCIGVVTDLYLTGGNTLNIAQTGCASPAASDAITFYDVAHISDGGGNVIVGAQVPFWRGPPGVSYPDSPTFTGTTTLSTIGFAGTTDTLRIGSGGFEFQFNGSDAAYIFSGGPYIPNGKAIELGGGASALQLDSGAGMSFQGRSWELATLPTASSGFATSPTVIGWGTATFEINEGATGSPSTTAVIGLPVASDGWHCTALDESSSSITARQSGTISTSAATFTFSSAPANSDKILFHCGGF